MAQQTGISWTHTVHPDGSVTKGSTWNAVRGCSRVDDGCINCYAEDMAHRFNGPGLPYEGLTVVNQSTGEPRWNGKVMLVEKHLLDPLRWQKPRRIFVNSMSDFFHPAIPDEWRDKMFAVMALCPQHTFQILTKREDEMWHYFVDNETSPLEMQTHSRVAEQAEYIRKANSRMSLPQVNSYVPGWPLPNVWLLVSANDQASADKRIPVLLRTPAAVRGVSLEPMTGPIDLMRPRTDLVQCACGHEAWTAFIDESLSLDLLECDDRDSDGAPCGAEFEAISLLRDLDWVIVGGESGPKARPFREEWALDIKQQCAAAGIAFYFKQYGSNAFTGANVHGKGDDPAEWPSDLQCQQFPGEVTA